MPDDTTKDILMGLLVTFLMVIVVQRCTNIHAGTTFVFLVALVLPLLYALVLTDRKDRMLFMAASMFGGLVVALAFVFSLVEAHKRPFSVYASAAFAVVLAGFLIVGKLFSGTPGIVNLNAEVS